MERNNLKSGIIIFIFSLILFVLVTKYLGHINRFTTAYIEPTSWHDIYSNLLLFIIVSLMITLTILQLIKKSNESKAKDIENAHKRIEEREKEKRMSKQNNKKRNQK
jgi:mannitol-specific phosphotransferase system IIBC component